jgi:hypothetical protein
MIMIFKQFFRSFFSRKKSQTFQASSAPSDSSELAKLRAKVLDLFVEVEALREALLMSPLGYGGARSPYGMAYLKTALLTHHAGGVANGHEKLMHQFYGQAYWGGEWRAFLFMRRLGFSTDDISQYLREAQEVETYT